MDWQLTGARFLPEPVLTPGTEAQGALEAQRGWRPAGPPGHALRSQLQTKAAMSCKYCQKQLGVTLMAD